MNKTDVVTSYGHPSYDDIHEECLNIVELLLQSDTKFDCIVGLSRGGLIPGVIISHLLKIPLITISFSAEQGEGKTKEVTDSFLLPIIPHTNILIVDDICDSGHTLHQVTSYYEDLGHNVNTYAIYCKQINNQIHYPMYSIGLDKDSEWIYFPWEF